MSKCKIAKLESPYKHYRVYWLTDDNKPDTETNRTYSTSRHYSIDTALIAKKILEDGHNFALSNNAETAFKEIRGKLIDKR